MFKRLSVLYYTEKAHVNSRFYETPAAFKPGDCHFNGGKTMLELRRLSVDDGPDIYRMLQDIPKEENGFEKITTLPPGVSPFDEIEKRDKEYERKMNELTALEEEFNEK